MMKQVDRMQRVESKRVGGNRISPNKARLNWEKKKARKKGMKTENPRRRGRRRLCQLQRIVFGRRRKSPNDDE